MSGTVPPELPYNGPVLQRDRVESLDVLRGFALLGILVMNVQSFGLPMPALEQPNVYGDLSGWNYWSWYLSHLLVDRKFMSIFSILFGAGVVLMGEHRDAAYQGSTSLHLRRIAVLLGIGMLHAYLFWYGDVLVTYACCGVWRS